MNGTIVRSFGFGLACEEMIVCDNMMMLLVGEDAMMNLKIFVDLWLFA